MLALIISTLHYPSLSALSEPTHEFAILAPADNSLLHAPANGTADLELRYIARGYTGRLCLTLTHGQLRYYRGPVLHRDESLLTPYAKGCFTIGQPITLQGLGTGMYSLAAELRSATADAVLAPPPPTVFFGVVEQVADAFVPTYEWQEVAEGQSVPSGLDVKLSLDGTHRTLARILPAWRLQVWPVDAAGAHPHGLGFVRHEVTRRSLLREVEAAAVAQARARGAGPACAAALWAGAEPLDASLSVEEAQLFARRGALKLVLDGCELLPAAAAHAVDGLDARRGVREAAPAHHEQQGSPPQAAPGGASSSAALVGVESSDS